MKPSNQGSSNTPPNQGSANNERRDSKAPGPPVNQTQQPISPQLGSQQRPQLPPITSQTGQQRPQLQPITAQSTQQRPLPQPITAQSTQQRPPPPANQQSIQKTSSVQPGSTAQQPKPPTAVPRSAPVTPRPPTNNNPPRKPGEKEPTHCDYCHIPEREKKQSQKKQWYFEVSWEVVNKLGGIYTVLKTKAQITVQELGDQYCMMGPYNEESAWMEVEVIDNPACPHVKKALQAARDEGFRVVYGRWLIEGYPKVVLFDISSATPKLDLWKKEIWDSVTIGIPWTDKDGNEAVLLGFMCAIFLDNFRKSIGAGSYLVAHFHEWTAGVGMIVCRTRHIDVATIFTTHATTLGRHLCAGKVDFYNNIDKFQLDKEAGDRSIYQRYCLERAMAHCAHVMTTVSDITSFEIEHILGRKPDIILPNGLNVKEGVLHEFQTRHWKAKEKINEFIRGHFHGHFDFDLEKTVYFFTAGRYEFSNKGADVFIESLARLNHYLKAGDLKITVIAFLIFPTKTNNFNVESLRGQAISKLLRETINNIQKDIGSRLFDACLKGTVPTPESLLTPEDEGKIKRCVFAARTKLLPPVCTHNVQEDATDPILCAIRRCRLFNEHSDKVKIIFHPEFLTEANPLLGMDYDEFVKGCNLGVFPSYYEPWGYTPAECTVAGIPSITTNLSGFGCYIAHQVVEPQAYGVYIVDRRYRSVEESIQQLANFMLQFCSMSRRERIVQRSKTEKLSRLLDWRHLGVQYRKARCLALNRLRPDLFNIDTSQSPRLDPVDDLYAVANSARTTPAHSDIDQDSSDDDFRKPKTKK